MLLSYIIPARNCGEFIGRCLDSILAQGLAEEDYEVIVVDDGSTDDTAAKVRACSAGRANMRLLSIPHGGVGKARNEGLRHASGRYVYFMDADDRLLPQGMKTLFDEYVIPEGFPSVVSFYAHTVDRYYDAEAWDVIRPHALLFRGTLAECARERGVCNSVWSHIVSRELLHRIRLGFSDHMIGEDMLFMLRLYGSGEASAVASSLDIYRYCLREGSAMTATDKGHLLKVFDSLADLWDRLGELKGASTLPASVIEADRDICRRWAFTRLCSAPLTVAETRECLAKADARGMFLTAGRPSAVNILIWAVSRSALAVRIFSAGYRGVFLPLVKPLLKRN